MANWWDALEAAPDFSNVQGSVSSTAPAAGNWWDALEAAPSAPSSGAPILGGNAAMAGDAGVPDFGNSGAPAPVLRNDGQPLAAGDFIMDGSEVPRLDSNGALASAPTNRDVLALQQAIGRGASPQAPADPFLSAPSAPARGGLMDSGAIDAANAQFGGGGFPRLGGAADFDVRFGRGAAQQYIGADAAPRPEAGAWWREQLGANGRMSYDLIDNPLTRGLAQAGNTAATGLSWVVGKGVGAVSPAAGQWWDRNETQPLAAQAEQLRAPADAGVLAAGTQALTNLGGQLAIGGAFGGAGATADATGIGLMGAARQAVANPATRMAGSLGVSQAGSEAAQLDAEGRPVSLGQFGTMAVTDTAANLVPLAGRWNLPARVVSGAAVGEGTNEASNIAAGRPVGTGAMMATGFGAALGVLPGHHNVTLADEGRALANQVLFGNRVDSLRDATARQDLDERLTAAAQQNGGVVHPAVAQQLADAVANEHGVSVDNLVRAPRNAMEAGTAAADQMLADMQQVVSIPEAPTAIRSDVLASAAPRAPALPDVQPGVSRDDLVQRWNAAQTEVEKAAAAASIHAFDLQAKRQPAEATPAWAAEIDNHPGLADSVRAGLRDRYTSAAQTLPTFDADVRQIADSVGGRAIVAPLKGVGRAAAKLIGDYEGNASKLKDLVRGTIEIPSHTDAQSVIDQLRAKYGDPIKLKNNLDPEQPPPFANGYRDVNSVWSINGEPVEVQVNVPEMLAAKEKAHPFYEQAQELERVSQKRPLTEDEEARLADLNAKQAAIYQPAWDAARMRLMPSYEASINSRLTDSGVAPDANLPTSLRNSSSDTSWASSRNTDIDLRTSSPSTSANAPTAEAGTGNPASTYTQGLPSTNPNLVPAGTSGSAAGRSDASAMGSTSTESVPPAQGAGDTWSRFSPDSGTLGIPRAEMPQIKAKDRGAFLDYLDSLGFGHKTESVPASSLKPTQAEFSPTKVEQFGLTGFGKGRSVMVSSDGHVLDGHHQWLAHRDAGLPIPVIRINAPIRDVLKAANDFPKVERSEGAPQADNQVSGHPIVDVPLHQLSLSKDVPQFKSGADANGVVEQLGGTFDDRGVGPIQVWRRLNGKLEVISGRHRLDLARRSPGKQTIRSQIYNEADGFTAADAAALDAELNIRDGQGKVKDYVQYFQHPAFGGEGGREQAEARGLLARATGRRAFTIASEGAPELIAAHSADRITDEAAVQIAHAAPGSERLQALGMKLVQDGKPISVAVNTMRAVRVMAGDKAPGQGDIFGFDDSAVREAVNMARVASTKQREIGEQIQAVSGAAKHPDKARALGVNVKDPASVQRRVDELRAERSEWESWASNPDLMRQVRTELGLGELPTRADDAAPAADASAVDDVTAPMFSRDASDVATADMFGAPRAAERATTRPADTAGDMFGGPTTRDHLGAAERAKDAQRNGLAGGREDAGDGGLFDGQRPEQTRVPDAASRAEEASAKIADRKVAAWKQQVADLVGKKPWEMTPDEWHRARSLVDAEVKGAEGMQMAGLNRAIREFRDLFGYGQAPEGNASHEVAVLHALERGEDVPKNVLDAYRDPSAFPYSPAHARKFKELIESARQTDLAGPRRSQEAEPAPAKFTAAQVRDSATKAWGNRFITKLERAGVLHFLTTDEAVARGLAKSADELAGVKGLYVDGKAYVITDQVRDLANVPGIVVHEAGLHYGYDRLTTQPERQALRNRVNRALAAGDKDVVAAWKHAEKVGTPAKALHEEAMAYLSENNPGHDIVTRLVDAVKRGLNRAGVPLDLLESDSEAIRRTARDMLRRAANPAEKAARVRVEPDGVQPWRASSIDGAPVFSRAWHGTPHRGIEREGFKLNKIGTGEGHQAYGFGIYFGGERAVGEAYRHNVKDMGRVQAINAEMSRLAKVMDADKVPGEYRKFRSDKGREAAARYDELMRERVAVRTDKGQLYHAEIPDDHELLDWDKPLSGQPAEVRAKLEAIGRELPDWAHEMLADRVNADWGDLTGNEMYQFIGRLASEDGLPQQASRVADGGSAQQMASQYLESHGIPGLRYLDGGSRGAGDGTHNYVIWDESRLNNDVTPYYSRDLLGDDDSPAAQVHQQAAITRQSVLSQLAAQGYGQGALGWTGNPNEYGGWRGGVQGALQKLADKMDPVKRVEQSITEATGRSIADDADAYRLENLMHGRVADRLDALDRTMVKPLLRSMKEQKLSPDLLMDYLYARHAPERNARIASINKGMPDGGSGMSTQLANDILAGKADGVYSGQRITADNLPALKLLAARVDRMREQTLATLESSGQITPALAASLRKQWQHYIPLRGKEGDAATGTSGQGAGRGVDIKGKPVKRALGRGDGNLAPNTILAEMVGDAQRAIIQAEKARVGRAILKLAAEHPNPDVWQVEPVDLEWKFSESTGETYLATRKPTNDKDVLTVVHEGTPYHVRLKDPRLQEAVLNMGAEKGEVFVRWIGKLNRWLSAAFTRYSPAFIPINAMRDATMGFSGLAAEHGAAVALSAAKGYFPAMRAAFRDARNAPGDASVPDAQKSMDDWAREFSENGGKTGIVKWERTEDTQKKLQREFERGMGFMYNLHANPRAAAAQSLQTLAPIIHAIEHTNDAVENAMRLSAYVALRKRGMSVDKAAMVAKDLTVNFNRKGSVGGIINSLFLFYNASVQGVRRSVQLMGNPKIQGFLGGIMALQASQTAILMARQDEDGISDWDAIPDYVKQRALIIALPGSGHYFAMPMPYEFGFLAYAGGRVTQWGMEKAGKGGDPSSHANVINDLGAGLFQSFSPIPLDNGFNGLIPTPLRIPVQVYANKNDFDHMIYNDHPMARYKMPAAASVRAGTAAPYVWMANALNRAGGGDDYHRPQIMQGMLDWSPNQLQFLVDSFVGGMGNFGNRAWGTTSKALAGNYKVAKDGTVQTDWPKLLSELPVLQRLGWNIDHGRAQSARFNDIEDNLERTRAQINDKLADGDFPGAQQAAREAGVFGDGWTIKTTQEGLPITTAKRVNGQTVRVPQLGTAPGSLAAAHKEAVQGLSMKPDGARYMQKVQPGLQDLNDQYRHAMTLPSTERERAIKQIRDEQSGLMGAFLRFYNQRKDAYDTAQSRQ